MIKTKVKFLNHASVCVGNNSAMILSDPWYYGDAFHKGWNLLHETTHGEIEELLSNVTHIWISHEHPDHFSIPFFKKYAKKIREYSIKILFQETRDRRVVGFLKSLSLDVQELKDKKKTKISDHFHVTCIKEGFYDSALLIECEGEKILNLNDCDITTRLSAQRIRRYTGPVDVLLTQFSFAAWKGGERNVSWRQQAAKDKISTIKLQLEVFLPKYLIPFASFIYFSNEENNYLNDAANTPLSVMNELEECSVSTVVLRPGDVFGDSRDWDKNIEALSFWSENYASVSTRVLHKYQTVTLSEITESFNNYCKRIDKFNSLALIKVARWMLPFEFFGPVTVEVTDLDTVLEIDYVNQKIQATESQPLLKMRSESLNFIFNNTFGFDTLTVNGCFEEGVKGGFVKATKSLAIENLNNLGISLSPRLILRLNIIGIFLFRLLRVSRKVNL